MPVAALRMWVQHSSNRKRDSRNMRIRKPDYKVASVQLARGQSFAFPDLFPETESSPAHKEQSEVLEDVKRRQSSDPRRGGIPDCVTDTGRDRWTQTLRRAILTIQISPALGRREGKKNEKNKVKGSLAFWIIVG